MAQDKLIREIVGQKLRSRLVKFVSQKVGNLMDVEEIVQDTLISALDSLPGFKNESSLSTWVLAIARHEVADFYRRQKIKQVFFSKLPFLKNLVSQALGPELAYQELETKKRILATFKNLSEGYAQILRLKYIEELSMRQIAQKLKITVKAVESKLTRARLAFVKTYALKDFSQNRFAAND
jgi:RNA polymerase sigma-70 factor (ECF subfamily)